MTQSNDPKDDKELFRAAMQGVKPLKSINKIESKPGPTKSPSKKSRVPNKIIRYQLPDDTFSDHIIENISGGQILNFARPGIQARVMHDLRRGKIPYTALLDLHGMTVIEARQTLTAFLQHCLKRFCKCVVIVHGKGALDSNKPPPLKNHLNSWLRQTPDVLAFCSALPRDGGTGAVYVLLRRQREL